jgi:hypothetical protein
VRRPPAHPEQQTGGAEGGPGGDPPPGVLATAIAPRLVVQPGRDARRSSANVRLSAAAQVQAAGPFVLDGLPGTTPAGHLPWSVVGRAFGACCFAGKLRSPAPPTGEPRSSGPWAPATPTSMGTSTPTAFPAPQMAYPSVPTHPHLSSSVPPGGPVGRKHRGRRAPLGGVVRTGRVVRFARLIQRPVRVLGGPSARAAYGGNLSLSWLPRRVGIVAPSSR